MSENINKLVHEKIFQKCWHDFSIHEHSWRICSKCKARRCFANMTLPNYSTSISDAFKVVDKLQSEGFNDFNVGAYGSQGVGYFAWFCKDGEEFQEGADTLAMAICLAALSAKGIKYD